jgi:hypothetical protein
MTTSILYDLIWGRFDLRPILFGVDLTCYLYLLCFKVVRDSSAVPPIPVLWLEIISIMIQWLVLLYMQKKYRDIIYWNVL